MALLFYADDCLMFSPSKDRIDDVYASLQEDSNIEDDADIRKKFGIDLDCRLYGSNHLIQIYLSQRIINMIPGMYM